MLAMLTAVAPIQEESRLGRCLKQLLSQALIKTLSRKHVFDLRRRRVFTDDFTDHEDQADG